jgi:hypothetical protein
MMNISTANTESMLRFHRFHERLNRSIKVQAIGLGLLAEEIDAGITAAALKQRMYSRQALWGGMPDWSGASEDVELAIRDIGQGGVLRAFSAFDLFLAQLEGELSSWRDFSGASAPVASTGDNEEDFDGDDEKDDLDRVERVYRRLGVSRGRVSDLWAVYRYFRRARNCIAHREGIASRTLVQAFETPELKPTLHRWTARTGEMTSPALVAVRFGDPIEFTHRQSIAASSVLRLLALDLGKLMISHLGEPGFVYLVARRVFLDDPPLPETATKSSMVKAFNTAMADRYRVRGYREEEGLRTLRQLGLTKACSARFGEIKKQAQTTEGTP